MRRIHFYIPFWSIFIGVFLKAQEVPTHHLNEVVVSDNRLEDYGEGYKVDRIADSVILRNGSLLTSLLSLNSSIYFKENGFGMVSSPAFRGTNASHTAVVWNGININSPLTGQLDFNTVTPLNYDNLVVRSGGSSTLYGTGAIGGSIHLNNELRFQKQFENRFFTRYGSFNTRSLHFRQDFGSEKWSYSVGLNNVASDNDYRYLGTEQRNENGEFEQWGINFSAGHRFGKSLLRLYHQSQLSDRNLSGLLVAPGRSRYEDERFQTQLHYQLNHKRGVSQLRVAHLHEAYKFYENKDNINFSSGWVNTLLTRYQFERELGSKLRFNTALQFSTLDGSGSNLENAQRQDFSSTVVLKHTVSDKFLYNLNVRKDFTSDFETPLVYGFDLRYHINSWYGIKMNGSRNFRIPTFNDLYWRPGGNLDLVPETSYQVDLGQEVRFGNAVVLVNGYYIATDDMIRWLPNSSGIWSPLNVDSVSIYGLEGDLGYSKQINTSQSMEFKLNYTYTISEDNDTGEQLIYVPYHRAAGSMAYQLGSFRLFYQHLYNGEVRIIGGKLEGYQIANGGFEYHSNGKAKWNYTLGITLNNVFNEYYENVALRPMPNRNIQTYLTLNF